MVARTPAGYGRVPPGRQEFAAQGSVLLAELRGFPADAQECFGSNGELNHG